MTSSSATSDASLIWALRDSTAMIGRSLRHVPRNVDSLLIGIVLPVMLMLLFVFVFGGAISTGTEYVTYVVPGVILLCAGYGAANTAVQVSADMSEGIIDRFRSLPITSSAVLTGHVVASLVRNAGSTMIVVAVAVAIGFRPMTGPGHWLAALAVIELYVLAISWVSAACGLLARSPDAASGFTFFVLFLPYLSSSFVPPETMPAVLRGFAEHQPITPINETVRGLLVGTPIGSNGWLAVAWCLGLTVVAMIAAGYLFRRRTAR